MDFFCLYYDGSINCLLSRMHECEIANKVKVKEEISAEEKFAKTKKRWIKCHQTITLTLFATPWIFFAFIMMADAADLLTCSVLISATHKGDP